jgi:multiple antibiotic resistance protein
MFWITVCQLFVLTAPGCFIPVFLSLTPKQSVGERMRVALIACMVAAGVLVAFALLGEYIFKFFGISLPAFKIAGGSYLMIISLGLLIDSPEDPPAKSQGKEITETHAASSSIGLAITPLGVPLLSGPGMISLVIIKCAESVTLTGKFFVAGAIFFAFVAFFCLMWLVALGAKWVNAFVLDLAGKFTGVYVAAVGILICCGGITSFIQNGLRTN